MHPGEYERRDDWMVELLTRMVGRPPVGGAILSSFVVGTLALCAVPSCTQVPASRTVGQLIDDLAQIHSQAPGIDGAGTYDSFLAEDKSPRFQVGVLGVAPPRVPKTMRELVRIGPPALPELLKHLDDRRPTKLSVGTDELGQRKNSQVGVNLFAHTAFSDEYDPRVHPPLNEQPFKNGSKPMDRSFHGRYTVKIGDVCFSIIGQIVNRRLYAVRYQPSAILVVNSPIEAPVLINEVRNDWAQADPEFVRQALLADIRAARGAKENDEGWPLIDVADGALRRLRFYFPDSYASLQGQDFMTKVAFEKRENEQN